MLSLVFAELATGNMIVKGPFYLSNLFMGQACFHLVDMQACVLCIFGLCLARPYEKIGQHNHWF